MLPGDLFRLLESMNERTQRAEATAAELRSRRAAYVLVGSRMGVSFGKMAEVLEVPEGTVRNMAAAAAREESQ